MKRFLTYVLSFAVICSLSLPAFAADYGKGNSGKSSPISPKSKRPKAKNPPSTTPTNPTTPTTPPVITKQPLTLNKNTSGKIVSKPIQTKDLVKDKAPQNNGPFPPDFHCGTNQPNNNNNDCHNGHCNDGHCGNGGHGGHGNNPPPIDPGKGDGKPPSQNPPPRDGYVWVPANGNVPGHWERERAPTTTPTKPGFVWVQATATVPAHWERARAK